MTIYFDLDGTLADLYGVRDWLPMLQASDTTPYRVAATTTDVNVLVDCMRQLVRKGYKLGVITWLAMGGSKKYNDATRAAKVRWVRRHFGDLITEFHSCKYGINKRRFSTSDDDVLVDDNAEVRQMWQGITIDASNTAAMVSELYTLAA